MIDRILDRVLDPNNNYSPEYIKSLENRIANFLEYSQLPLAFIKKFIDPTRVSKRLLELENQQVEMIEGDGDHNKVVLLDTYKESGFITSYLVESYVVDCLKKNKHIRSVLYVDTNLLLKDYKNTFNNDMGASHELIHHSLNTINKEIYSADFVFWDKFTLPLGGTYSPYDVNKLYDILSIRYRNCLGNLFYINNEELIKSFNAEFCGVMNIPGFHITDFRGERYVHLQVQLDEAEQEQENK